MGLWLLSGSSWTVLDRWMCVAAWEGRRPALQTAAAAPQGSQCWTTRAAPSPADAQAACRGRPPTCRGVALEALGRFDEAVADYRAVLAVAPGDPAAWNNLGNALAGKGDWCAAVWGCGGMGGRVSVAAAWPRMPLAAAPRPCCRRSRLCHAAAAASHTRHGREAAAECYGKAVQLAPQFSFAAVRGV